MLINDFTMERKIDADIIEKYRSRVSDEIIEMWNEYGEGSFCNGYFRIVNPDDYAELICETYFRGQCAVPLFVTAFGDVITWEENAYLGMINYKSEDFNIIVKSFSLFFRFLDEKYFTDKFFDFILFEEARKKLGELSIDESYGFVPILPLGGKKDVNHLDIVKTRECTELITQLAGNIGME